MSQISGSKNAKVIKKTTADWAGGFVIPLGLIGYDTDTDELKVGDGVNTWAALPSLSGSGSSACGLLDYLVAALTINENYQYIIYNKITIDGILTLDGKLVIT